MKLPEPKRLHSNEVSPKWRCEQGIIIDTEKNKIEGNKILTKGVNMCGQGICFLITINSLLFKSLPINQHPSIIINQS